MIAQITVIYLIAIFGTILSRCSSSPKNWRDLPMMKPRREYGAGLFLKIPLE
jgi:hypothetical protein